jgi:Flp pilus assembly protein TadG
MRGSVGLRHAKRARRGKTLAQFILTLPVLLGMIGLVLDSGLLMATQRTAQNAADAGALAAAMDLYRGVSTATAQSTGTTFVQTYNGLSSATVTINIPPTSGPYLNNSKYAEAIVQLPMTTTFIQILGINSSQNVSARAVAGYEPIAAGEGAIVLRPDVTTGINISGTNAQLVVNGGITVNARGGGVDQYGNAVSPNPPVGFSTSTSVKNPAPVAAVAIQVAGGIDTLDNFRAYDVTFAPPNGNYYDPNNIDRPVFANLQTAAPDPLQSLATPTTSNGVPSVSVYPNYLGGGAWDLTPTTPQDFNVQDNAGTFPAGIYGNVTFSGNSTATLVPGIYSSLGFNGGTVTLNSGIYVLNAANLKGSQPQSFSVSNGATITSASGGVMIYNTGSDYNPSTGTPDTNDGSTLGSDPQNPQMGQISINGGAVNLSPITTSSSPFAGVLLYQRRWNALQASVGGNSNTVNLSGTIYDKWGDFKLAGQGRYQAEFVVGTLTISGNGTVTIDATGKMQGRVNQVFLVE